MARLTLTNVRKSYARGMEALRDVSIEIHTNEYVTLVGASGAGKSSLLRVIAGLEAPTSGRIEIDGASVLGVPADRRGVAMVFQSDALFPHLSARKNIGLGLRMRGAARGEIRARIEEAAGALGIAHLLDRRPGRMSGGERRRVSLARAVAGRAGIVLLDEPLASLDEGARSEARGVLRDLHARFGITMLHVTHDQQEALSLGQRVAVLGDGLIRQIGTPEEVSSRPANLFVARSLGGADLTLIPGTLVADDAGVRFEESARDGGREGDRPPVRLVLPPKAATRVREHVGVPVTMATTAGGLGVRSRRATLAIPATAWRDGGADDGRASLQVSVDRTEWIGVGRRVVGRTGGGHLVTARVGRAAACPPTGARIVAGFDWDEVWLFEGVGDAGHDRKTTAGRLWT